MENLILIPARSGSTRVKNKNLRPLGGVPLIGHAIKSALASKAGRVVLSTNDETIAATARELGAETPFLRPPELATSTAPSLPVILHALDWLEKNEGFRADMVAYCPPTNPFLKPETLRDMFATLAARPDCMSMETITAPAAHPFTIVFQGEDGRILTGAIEIQGKTILDVERSQDWPEVWQGSPACRLSRASFFRDILDNDPDWMSRSGRTYDHTNCLGHRVDPLQAMDIDDEDDWRMAETVMARLNRDAG